ncbi:diacylglycerol kinase 7-like, partial [Trifolium medium]|nr:diacylglycerol kinase 7-like [Trifolium medium]
SSSSTGNDANKFAIRSSIVESIRGCGISGQRIDKEELKRNLTMPLYLRMAMRDSIRLKDSAAGESFFLREADDDNAAVAPLTPIVVFINPRSGGRHGPVLMERLQDLMSEEQVTG